jgi:hypothetical protein
MRRAGLGPARPAAPGLVADEPAAAAQLAPFGHGLDHRWTVYLLDRDARLVGAAAFSRIEAEVTDDPSVGQGAGRDVHESDEARLVPPVARPTTPTRRPSARRYSHRASQGRTFS